MENVWNERVDFVLQDLLEDGEEVPVELPHGAVHVAADRLDDQREGLEQVVHVVGLRGVLRNLRRW